MIPNHTTPLVNEQARGQVLGPCCVDDVATVSCGSLVKIDCATKLGVQHGFELQHLFFALSNPVGCI